MLLIDRPGGEGGVAPAGPALEQRTLDLRLDLGATFARPRLISEWLLRRRAVRSFDPAELHGLLLETDCELVIVDIEETEALIAALEVDDRVRVAALSSFFCLWPSWDVPPLDSPVLPGPRPADRVRVTRAWLTTWLRAEKDSVYRRLRADGLGRVETLRSLARARGVRGAMTRWQWLRPFVPRTVPILQATATELDLPATLPSHVQPIGPLLDLSVGPETVDDPELLAVLERATSNQQPIVICVFGAFLAAGDDFSDRLAAAAGLRPDVQFIVAADRDDPRWQNVANAFTTPWLPQRELLALASAAIIHSGTGTLHECAAAGVPSVVYPFSFNDQLGNASRVRHHGIGLIGDRENDTPTVMAAQLDRLLTDEQYRSRLERFPETIARYERENVAVVAVEQLLSGDRRGISGDGHTPP